MARDLTQALAARGTALMERGIQALLESNAGGLWRLTAIRSSQA